MRAGTLATLAGSLLCARVLAGDPAHPSGPTVGTLLAVCERAAAAGNRGVDAAMCEWYAAPCACKLRGTATEPWCVPEGEDPGVTTKKVLAELRRGVDPATLAEPAVAAALARLYPCPAAAAKSGAAGP